MDAGLGPALLEGLRHEPGDAELVGPGDVDLAASRSDSASQSVQNARVTAPCAQAARPEAELEDGTGHQRFGGSRRARIARAVGDRPEGVDERLLDRENSPKLGRTGELLVAARALGEPEGPARRCARRRGRPAARPRHRGGTSTDARRAGRRRPTQTGSRGDCAPRSSMTSAAQAAAPPPGRRPIPRPPYCPRGPSASSPTILAAAGKRRQLAIAPRAGGPGVSLRISGSTE